ncbi:Hpt domain-containing protein [Sinisalibacter aestuarii]|uniref:Nickel transporter n=1 Tax=Sinisalibacter aestuarii TaxID=2949426 RepID=A0ABQ5LPX6_9RHOB|nr:Hpt domain-containing protein [Sinisalibacter aestuarii]GKY86470.1 nickel transporter [Sinisalibacter aestuarii]
MVDWQRVRMLKDEIGEEDFAEVAALFISEIDDVIARLKSAPEPDRLEHDLHFMKSSALNLGFSRLAALCQEGERRAADGAADIDLAPIFTAYAASKTAFLAG